MTSEAQVSNVFSQVGSSATLGTNDASVRTITADQSVSVNTDANLHGRALALNGSVTMDDFVVSEPGCPGPGAE